MHSMTHKELISRAEDQLADHIVKADITIGTLANDFPNSVVTTSRRFNVDGQPLNVLELYQWSGEAQKFVFIREVYREINTKKKATISIKRELDCLINELSRAKNYLDSDLDYVQQIVSDAKRLIEIVEKSII